MKLSVTISAVAGLTWARWKDLIGAVEQFGLAGMYFSDHVVGPATPEPPCLDVIPALTYLADHSRQIHFGTMVSPLSIRDPVLLARQAADLADLSDGRMILGVGAGWLEREHIMFGYALGDIPTRMARLAEGLAVITGLLRADAPVSYDGQFYRLREAMLPPHPQWVASLPILVGGSGPQRTLPLVARYADIWNAQIPLDAFKERSAQLDALLIKAGRRPDAVVRTMQVPIFCAEDTAELTRRVKPLLSLPVFAFANQSMDAVLDFMRTRFAAVIGTRSEVIEQLKAYAMAGMSEIMVHWLALDDFEGLQVLGEEIAPRLA